MNFSSCENFYSRYNNDFFSKIMRKATSEWDESIYIHFLNGELKPASN